MLKNRNFPLSFYGIQFKSTFHLIFSLLFVKKNLFSNLLNICTSSAKQLFGSRQGFEFTCFWSSSCPGSVLCIHVKISCIRFNEKFNKNIYHHCRCNRYPYNYDFSLPSGDIYRNTIKSMTTLYSNFVKYG